MDSLEVNKAVAAVLVAGIAFMVPGVIAGTLVRPKPLAKPAIAVEAAPGTSAPAAPEQDPPVAQLLASADVQRGQADTAKLGCIACHSFNQGGKAGVGPNLYGVVGAPHGHAAGFDYSAVLKAKAGPWTYDALYAWLKKPSAYAPGTKMSFAGVADPKVRADVITYLRSLSDHPEPLPAAPAQPPPAQAATAAPPAAGAPVTAPAGEDPPVEALLASADAKKGQAATMSAGCIACHTFNEGGKAGLGPNLYGVVGGPHAHMQGYAYSNALKAKEGPWTYPELYQWLKKPAAYAPGTKMTFAGLPDPQQRADVIAYLRSLSPQPEPLPGQAAQPRSTN